MRIAVIICTHNPRESSLARTLSALQNQTLPTSEWSLLVVDNASKTPLRPDLVSWHPSGRIVREDELGLTAARRRGVAESSSAALLVFVDDDNLLAPGYLSEVARIDREWPMLGLWGCGHYLPEWESPPPPEFSPYLTYLAVGRRDRDSWSNHPFDYQAMPAGAGLCVRAPVALRYGELVATDPRRLSLGRRGGNLAACEDFDLGMTAVGMGYGVGIFTCLRLTHLMPAGRVQEEYLLRLAEGHARSTVILHHLHGRAVPVRRGWLAKLRRWRRRRTLGSIERRLESALHRGEAAGHAELEQFPRG